jgi:phosphatidylglycerophosphate synthase
VCVCVYLADLVFATGSSSPLGNLFDHTADVVSVQALMVCMAITCMLDQTWYARADAEISVLSGDYMALLLSSLLRVIV